MELFFLNVTSVLCLIASLKIKMYKTNFIGFIVILSITLYLILASRFEYLFETWSYLVSILLIWIVFHNTYRNITNRCWKKDPDTVVE